MKPFNQIFLSAITDLLNDLDSIEITYSKCSSELFWIECKVHSFYALLLLNHFAESANFQFPSWTTTNPYSETANNNPATAITHLIKIESQSPNCHDALFTLKTLGQLIIRHRKKIGELTPEKAQQANVFWLYEDDEG